MKRFGNFLDPVSSSVQISIGQCLVLRNSSRVMAFSQMRRSEIGVGDM